MRTTTIIIVLFLFSGGVVPVPAEAGIKDAFKSFGEKIKKEFGGKTDDANPSPSENHEEWVNPRFDPDTPPSKNKNSDNNTSNTSNTDKNAREPSHSSKGGALSGVRAGTTTEEKPEGGGGLTSIDINKGMRPPAQGPDDIKDIPLPDNPEGTGLFDGKESPEEAAARRRHDNAVKDARTTTENEALDMLDRNGVITNIPRLRAEKQEIRAEFRQVKREIPGESRLNEIAVNRITQEYYAKK